MIEIDNTAGWQTIIKKMQTRHAKQIMQLLHESTIKDIKPECPMCHSKNVTKEHYEDSEAFGVCRECTCGDEFIMFLKSGFEHDN
jgi:hypothetical protein